MIQKHIILGRDTRDAEANRDRWISENPRVIVLKVHPLKAEPTTLLTRIGGWNVPRVSIEVDYDDMELTGSTFGTAFEEKMQQRQ
jgi:hypothetical protein